MHAHKKYFHKYDILTLQRAKSAVRIVNYSYCIRCYSAYFDLVSFWIILHSAMVSHSLHKVTRQPSSPSPMYWSESPSPVYVRFMEISNQRVFQHDHYPFPKAHRIYLTLYLQVFIQWIVVRQSPWNNLCAAAEWESSFRYQMPYPAMKSFVTKSFSHFCFSIVPLNLKKEVWEIFIVNWQLRIKTQLLLHSIFTNFRQLCRTTNSNLTQFESSLPVWWILLKARANWLKRR